MMMIKVVILHEPAAGENDEHGDVDELTE